MSSDEAQPVDVLLVNGTVVTMDGMGTVVPAGAVAIAARQIVAVGPAAELRARFRAEEEVDCSGCAILPGLINAHAHVPMSLLRGLVADVQLDVWLYGYMFPVESQFVDAAFSYAGTRLSCAEMIRSGTTTFVDMYYFEDQVARAADEAGLRAICGQSVMRFPTPDAPSYDAGLERARAFIHAWNGHDRITPTVAPHAPYTCTDEIYHEAVALAREYNVPLITHLSETAREVKESLESVNCSPVAYAESVGAFDVPAIAAHCVHTDERDWAILRAHGAGVVPCPASNLKLASGVAPFAGMLAAGINLGIGSDGPASNDDQDMLTEVHLAAMLPKGLGNDPTLVPARQALALATSLGAKAVHLQHLIGSLEAGKRADVIVVELTDLHAMPRYRYSADAIYNYLVYAAHGSDVRDTLVDGRFLMRDRVLQTMDEEEVKREAQTIADRIDAFLREREANLLDKILAIGGVTQDESFEVQVKARLVDEERLMELLGSPDITINKWSERTQYDTYFLFNDPARGRVRYREDHRRDPGARLDPKYALTLTVPAAARNQYPQAIVLSRARYTAPADRSLRFYREYFGAERVVEIEKQRRRWRIVYKGEDFAVNFDRLANHPEPGPYLEIKSRTWSQRDAERKAELIGELLARLGVGSEQLVRLEYIEMLPGYSR
ncbi:MAG: amidohydrolase family protein [Chloroflexota bacterium]|nr:amidohydrolase family protein [Chloroflexota bacterium]